MEIIEEEVRPKREVKGITDKVTQSAISEIQYPVINILLDTAVPRYKLEALSRLLKSHVKDDNIDGVEQDLSVYVALKTDKVYKPIGRIMPKQIKTFMSIVHGLKVELEVEEGKIMDAKYIYALST
jgi:hypothetical protein